MSKFIEIAVDVIAQADKALLVSDGATEAWIPRSQIDDYCEERGRITTIFITEWLAAQKGLI